MVTLSFVITACGSKSTTCSFKETLFATRSRIGTLKCNPTPHVSLYPPSRSTTYACACGTIRIFDTRSHTTIIIMIIQIISPNIIAHPPHISLKSVLLRKLLLLWQANLSQFCPCLTCTLQSIPFPAQLQYRSVQNYQPSLLP